MTGPSIRVQRHVEWSDTDASGHYHHSTIIRWVEHAESVLLAEYGITNLFGRTPRVRYEVDYLARLWFGQSADVALWLERLGRTSLTFGFSVHAGDAVAARGRMVIVHAHPDGDGPEPWPEHIRAALGGS